jgi:hypothetical protein
MQISAANYSINISRVIYTGTIGSGVAMWIGVGYATGVGSTPGAIAMKSTDGFSWSDYSIAGSTGGYTDVYWDGMNAVAVGTNIIASTFSLQLPSSWNPSPWSVSNIQNVVGSTNLTYNFLGVVSNGSTWVAVGSKTTAGTSMIAIFTIQMARNSQVTQWGWTEIIYSGLPTGAGAMGTGNTIALLPNGLFIMGASNATTGALYTSPDGNNWTLIYTSSSPMIPQRILMNNYANNTIIMATYQTELLYSTNNGSTWTPLSLVGVSTYFGNAPNPVLQSYLTDIRMINATTAIVVGYTSNTGASPTALTPIINTINVSATIPTANPIVLPTLLNTLAIQSVASTYVPIFPAVPLMFGSINGGNAKSLYSYNVNNNNYNAITSWTNYSSTTSLNVNKIIYTGNLWLVAGTTIQNGVGAGGVGFVNIFSSTDGITIIAPLPLNYSSNGDISGAVLTSLYDICWNGSMAVAVGTLGVAGSNRPLIYSSSDVTNWIMSSPGGSTINITMNSVVYNGTMWCAVGSGLLQSTSTIMCVTITSPDGITWPSSTVVAKTAGNIPIATSNGAIVTIGVYRGNFFMSNGNILYSSPDAGIWTAIASNPFANGFWITKIITINGLLVVAGYNYTLGFGAMAYAYYSSNSGSAWTGIMGPSIQSGQINAYTITDIKLISPTMAMMVGYVTVNTYPTNTIPLTLVSSDGMSWTRINSGYGATTGQSLIQTFSGTYSEIVLDNDPDIGTTTTLTNTASFAFNNYTSKINAIPTYIYIPSISLSGPSVVLTLNITQTLSSSLIQVASGTFTLNQNYPNGISIPLTTATGVFIQNTAIVTYTLSIPTTSGTTSITVPVNFGSLVATLYGYTYFLPIALTLPSGTQWYIPSPITYLAGKQSYGNLISTSVPSAATVSGQITYTSTTTGTDSVALATNPTTNSQMLQLTLGSSLATINVIASYPGNNVYAATSVTQIVYTKNYIPVSPQAAMFFNKSGISQSGTVPAEMSQGSFSVYATASVTINITNSVTLS